MGTWNKILDMLQFEPDDDLEEEVVNDRKQPVKPKAAETTPKTEEPVIKASVEADNDNRTVRPQVSAQPEMRRAALNKQSKPSIIRKKGQVETMELVVIKPTSFEESRDIVDSLLSEHAVVLNVEGIDNYIAQRIIDFVSGACFAINGNLQKVANYIFVVTPENVELSGDMAGMMEGFGLTLL